MRYTVDVKDYGNYDVVVCGGGTAGAFAAIAAAREGAKTLIIERSFAVGGMLTIGNAGITKFTEHCNSADKYKSEVLDALSSNPRSVQVVGGIPLEYVNRMLKEKTALGTHGEAGSYVFTDMCEARWVLMDMLEEAGAEVLYDTRICDVLKDGDRITDIIVCNKDGFSKITAESFIDATGDGDVAALAGAPFNKGATKEDVEEGGAKDVGDMIYFGTMYRVRNVDFEKLFDWLEKNPDEFLEHRFGVMTLENVRESHRNGEMCVFRFYVDTPDMGRLAVQVYNLPQKDEAILLSKYCAFMGGDGLDARSLSRGQEGLHKGVRRMNKLLEKIPGFENITTLFVPDAGVRETRHIIGEYTLTALDVMSGKEFEDSIGCGGHPVDIDTIPDEIRNAPMNHWRFFIPYSIMVPKKVDNLLITGRCVSATRIASGAIRPTAQCMVMGEAAGTAAALATKNKVSCRSLDTKLLRKVLKDNNVVC